MASRQAENQESSEPEQFAGNRDFVRHLIHARAYQQAALYTADRDVLDLGCRTGDGTRLLKVSGARVVGIDPMPEAVATDRRRFDRSGIDFRRSDGSALPFADRSFDIVTCFRQLERIVDPAPVLTEISRVLRPGGKAIFTTPNRLLRLYPGTRPWNLDHVREYGAEELKALLRRQFAETELLGLFAARAIYEVETERVWVLRERARIKQSPEGTSPGGRLKLFLLHLRSQVKKRLLDRDGRFRQRYTPRDLYYKRENFDAALDLMAICTAAPMGSEG